MILDFPERLCRVRGKRADGRLLTFKGQAEAWRPGGEGGEAVRDGRDWEEQGHTEPTLERRQP